MLGSRHPPHAILDGTSKAVKELVEIRIDNQRVGVLTPPMSGAYLPIIQQLSERGRATAAKLIVKGNQVHAEAVLHAAKAHELDASWLASHLSGGAGADNLREPSAGRSSAVFVHQYRQTNPHPLSRATWLASGAVGLGARAGLGARSELATGTG
jgi:hypothetical protein